VIRYGRHWHSLTTLTTSTALLILFCGPATLTASANAEGDVHFQHALDYQLQQNVQGADAEFQRALELDADSVTGRDNYGVFLMEQKGDLDGAISEFVTALGIDPKCIGCQRHLDEAVALRNSGGEFNSNRANDLYRTNQIVRAAAAYRIACSVDPKDGETRNSLAWTLYRLGQLNEAIKQVNIALELKPNEPEYINTLASILLDQGDWKGALEQFKLAISKSEKPNPADLYGVAVCLLSGDQTDNAIDSFKAALKSDPNFADLKYLRDRVGMSVNALALHDKLLSLSGWNADATKAPDAR
jgi:Tfp pilus assembly protein PilF